jgi:hypothetical protein
VPGTELGSIQMQTHLFFTTLPRGTYYLHFK